MKSILILFLCICSALPSFAQKIKLQRRYINHTELGGLLGRVKYNNGGMQSVVESKFSPSAQTFNGIRLSSRLAAGVTVGMDWYKTALITPLAIGARYDLTKRGPARLYAFADAGYGTTWLHQDSDGYNTKGGLMLNPGIGLKYGRPPGVAFTISVSYKRQEVSVAKPLWSEQTYRHEERIYNRFALKIGMVF